MHNHTHVPWVDKAKTRKALAQACIVEQRENARSGRCSRRGTTLRRHRKGGGEINTPASIV